MAQPFKVPNNMTQTGEGAMLLHFMDKAAKEKAQQNSTAPEQPTLSAQEVQNAVNQGAANNAATAMPGSMSISRIGQTGGKVPVVPGIVDAYNNVYSGPMTQIMNDLLNTKGFNYDVNADGLYQQIKDNYMKQGRQAMMNAQGQSAALTGGYGNSYGASAGQQAYQESLGNLQNMIPELQQIAFQQYQQGQDDKRNNLEALNKLEAQEYARWMDEQELRLKLYEAFPQLLQAQENGGMGPTVGGGGGGNLDYAMGQMIIDAMKPKAGAASNIYNPDQYLALDGLSDSQKKAFYNIISNGGNLSGIDANTATRWANDYAAANGLGGNMPTVGLKIAGTKAITGANGAGNNNVVFTSNAGNEELNAGLNTNKKTYNGLFSFNKH